MCDVPPHPISKVIGCYAQTELGHGSNIRALETTATFIRETDEFDIHTPSITATKWCSCSTSLGHLWGRAAVDRTRGLLVGWSFQILWSIQSVTSDIGVFLAKWSTKGNFVMPLSCTSSIWSPTLQLRRKSILVTHEPYVTVHETRGRAFYWL